MKCLAAIWLFALICAARGYVHGGHVHGEHVHGGHKPHPTPAPKSPLVTEYEWKYFDYVWKSAEHRDYYARNGLYEPRNMTPIDVDRSQDGRTFVTIIRSGGVPASLHTVSNMRGPSGPLLVPYPNWSWYENNDDPCNGITSVYRVAIDKCNRLWVLDTGMIDDRQVCPAQLLTFNLYNDRLLFKLKIADNVAQDKNGEGLLITPIVETYGHICDNTTVYMADVAGHGLVVWNGQRVFRLEADVFEPEEYYANFDIAGESFYLADGVLGMALSPIQYPGESRYLSFRPLASKSLYAADTRVIQRSIDGTKIKYFRGRNVLPSQASAMAFSEGGTLFYGLTKEIAIGCWNIKKPLQPEYFKIAVQDYERLQFVSGMKVIKNPVFFPLQEEQVIMLSNRLQKIYAGTMKFNEINFRILRAPVKELIAGTVCDSN